MISDWIITRTKNLPCPNCSTAFTSKGSLTRHLRYECGQEPRFACPYCLHRAKKTYDVYNHVRNLHDGKKVFCVHDFAEENLVDGKITRVALRQWKKDA